MNDMFVTEVDPEMEAHILSIGDEFLPDFAIAVRDGGEPDLKYEAWLAGQIVEMGRGA